MLKTLTKLGGRLAEDHSVIINGLIVCTIGKNVGDRLNSQWPELDARLKIIALHNKSSDMGEAIGQRINNNVNKKHVC